MLGVAKVAVWGRSMGASTAVLYASSRAPDTACVIADSSFASLEQAHSR